MTVPFKADNPGGGCCVDGCANCGTTGTGLTAIVNMGAGGWANPYCSSCAAIAVLGGASGQDELLPRDLVSLASPGKPLGGVEAQRQEALLARCECGLVGLVERKLEVAVPTRGDVQGTELAALSRDPVDGELPAAHQPVEAGEVALAPHPDPPPTQGFILLDSGVFWV